MSLPRDRCMWISQSRILPEMVHRRQYGSVTIEFKYKLIFEVSGMSLRKFFSCNEIAREVLLRDYSTESSAKLS